MAPGKAVGLTMGRLNNGKQCICQIPSDIVLGPRGGLKTASRVDVRGMQAGRHLGKVVLCTREIKSALTLKALLLIII